MSKKLRVAIGIYGMQDFFGGDLRQVVESIRIADQVGIDQVSMTDHVVMGERTDRYPYGDFPSPSTYPWYEPISTLSAIAAVTDNIRLSTGILITPLRPAVLLAKQLATLDVLSRGRVEIGIGTGWQEEEYIASGVPFEGRYTRMDEQIRVCRTLWSEAPAAFNGSTVQFDKIHAFPRPAQGRDLPVWYGVAPTPRNCQRIAELGSGWIPIMYDPKKIAEGVDAIKAAFKAAGRNPDELEVRAQLRPHFDANGAPNYDETLKSLDAAVQAGATMIEMLPIIFCRSPEDLPKFYEKVLKIKDM